MRQEKRGGRGTTLPFNYSIRNEKVLSLVKDSNGYYEFNTNNCNFYEMKKLLKYNLAKPTLEKYKNPSGSVSPKEIKSLIKNLLLEQLHAPAASHLNSSKH